ncbi:MAG TPA: SseB family protein [Segeticoccus sp.]|nr:SseB family protein [Segeticoccus sp.]
MTSPQGHDGGPDDGPDPAFADTAGVPWQDRQLSGTGFNQDDGSADPALVEVVRDRSPEGERALVAAVAAARWMVPVVATEAGGPTEPSPEGSSPGLRAETSTEMAAVTLTAPDGQRALPLFSGLDALRAWDPDARPVPVTAARAAQAAVQERCQVLVLDPRSDHERALRPSMLWALATGREWLPAHDDPFVSRALQGAVAEEPDVVTFRAEAGDPTGTLRVVLHLRPGLAPKQLEGLVTRLGERLATDGETRARVDGIAFAVRPADR